MIRNFLYRSFSALGTGEVRSLEQASLKPREAQQARLLEIIKTNQDSAFGKDHGFAGIETIEQFQKAVPVRDYDQLGTYLTRAIKGERQVLTAQEPFAFATTSGTSGSAKLIPLTSGYLKEFRRASVVSGYNLLKTFPGIKAGVTLSVASSAEEGHTEGGTVYGAISGHLFLREPALIRRYISPIPYEVYLIKDYETRYYTLLRLALCLPLTCFYTLNPSTILLLCKKLETYGPRLVADIARGQIDPPSPLPETVRAAIGKFLKPQKQRAAQLEQLLLSQQFRPHKIWPMLQVASCWTKAAASFYLEDLKEYFGPVPVCDITYGASEGRGTVFLSPDKQMLAVRSHFFEFIPESQIDSQHPDVLTAQDVEVGRNYYILFTTSGGLYRYHINDVVKVVGFHNSTPLLEFQYKGGNVCSFTGEKITELQVVQSMTETLRQLNVKAGFFTLVPQYKPAPHYEIWIEPLRTSQAAPEFNPELPVIFDRHLATMNSEYEVKRESQRLGQVQMKILQEGTYESLRKCLAQSGVADSQIKVSHLNPKQTVRDHLQQNLFAGAII